MSFRLAIPYCYPPVSWRLAQKCKLQIANCKLKIERTGPALRRRITLVSILQFAICNSQFAICNTFRKLCGCGSAVPGKTPAPLCSLFRKGRRRGVLLVLAALLPVASASGQETVRLKESLPAGLQYHVSSRADLAGSLTLPADKDGKSKTLPVTGSSIIEYDERILDGDAKGPVEKTLRIYRQMDFKRTVGEQKQASSIRGEVRRMVLLKYKQSEVPFSPDGPLTWGEIDLVRTDVFGPALQGLLPQKEVKVGARWDAETRAAEELTDLDQAKGKLECRLQELVTRGGRRFAQISFAGTISGVNDDGPNRQELEGDFFFDLQSNHLSYLYVNGVSSLLDKDGKARGKIEGKYVLTRRLEPVADLADDVVRKLTVEPTPENTLLLFDEPALGVRFTYARRWQVQRADARQIVLEGQGGGGLVITLEPLTQTPTGKQFQTEATGALQKQGARLTRTEAAQTIRSAPDPIERFFFEAEIGKTLMQMDYYVVRQVMGGATIAGQYPIRESAAMQKDVEGTVRSLRLIPPKK